MVQARPAQARLARTNMIEKGKKAITSAVEQTPVKPMFGGNNPKGFSLEERRNKVYPFKQEKVKKIFYDAVKNGLQLPEPKKPEDVGKTDNPKYCLYHRLISHPIEDCWVFKDWVEKQYKTGAITLSQSVLSETPVEKTNVIGVGAENIEGIENELPPEFWNIFLSKKTRKMLKHLKEVPGIKWRGPLNPEVQSEDKPMPPTKKFNTPAKLMRRITRAKKNKKFVEPAEPQHKKRPIEEHIDSMEEYKQVEIEPLLIHDFISKAIEEAKKKKDSDKKELSVEECKEEGEPFWGETCRVITARRDDEEIIFSATHLREQEKNLREVHVQLAEIKEMTRCNFHKVNDKILDMTAQLNVMFSMMIGIEARVEQLMKITPPPQQSQLQNNRERDIELLPRPITRSLNQHSV